MLIEFVDLEKALNKVNFQKLFQILQQIGVDFKDRQLINNFYKHQSADI